MCAQSGKTNQNNSATTSKSDTVTHDYRVPDSMNATITESNITIIGTSGANDTSVKFPISHSAMIIFNAYNAFIIITGIPGNLVAAAVLARNTMRKIPGSIFLIVMTLADAATIPFNPVLVQLQLTLGVS